MFGEEVRSIERVDFPDSPAAGWTETSGPQLSSPALPALAENRSLASSTRQCARSPESTTQLTESAAWTGARMIACAELAKVPPSHVGTADDCRYWVVLPASGMCAASRNVSGNVLPKAAMLNVTLSLFWLFVEG